MEEIKSEKKLKNAIDGKKFVANLEEKKIIFKRNERRLILIIKDVNYYKTGAIYKPQKLVAEEIVNNKVARFLTKEEEKFYIQNRRLLPAKK